MAMVKVIYLKDGKGKPLTNQGSQLLPDREYMMKEEIALKLEKRGQVKIISSASIKVSVSKKSE
jgi:hypothetical protein